MKRLLAATMMAGSNLPVGRIGAAAIAWLGLGSVAMAGNVIPQQEYNKYIDKHRTIQALDSSLFGEQINLRDGGVMFRVVDEELPGNGPTIRIARTLQIRENSRFLATSGTDLGDWMLQVPRLKTITNFTATSTSIYGWQVPGANKNLRCTNFNPPGPVLFYDASRFWEDYEWWSGYQLVDDLGNEQEMLRAGGPMYPELAGYKAVTSSNWRFSCLPTTANGEPGEGFLGTSPDGTKYWLNYLVYTSADSMTKPIGSTPMSKSAGATASKKPEELPTEDPMGLAGNDYLLRRHAMLLVTRVEDRFGNYLTYQYTAGRLVKITANDGRLLEVSAATSPTTISLNSGTAKRTWTYTPGATTTVALPDGSAWTYNFSALTSAGVPALATYKTGLCGINTTNTGATMQATAISPSGVTGTFTFQLRRFGRSYVPKECFDPDGDGDGFAAFPADWFSYALTQRSFSGPGLTPSTWTYAYSPAYASWDESCGGGCTAEVWNDVTAPDGTRQRSVFSNRFDETDNLLLREETYASTGALMRKVTHSYATYPAWIPGTPYAWPEVIGDDMQARTNKAKTERWTPASKHQTEQQGRIFTWQVPSTCGTSGTSPCFDKFARPTKVVKASSP